MTTSKSMQNLLVDIANAIGEVKSAFGAPGDYGYNTGEGLALFNLYKLRPEIHDALDARAVAERCPAAVTQELLFAAKEVMADLERYGPSIVPYLLDDDDNAGRRLRLSIAKAECLE